MTWIRVYGPCEKLNATALDMRALWWAYCGTAAIEALEAFPQMWMCGVPADGA